MLLKSSVTLTQYRESVDSLYSSLNSEMFESLYHYTSTGYKKINEDLVYRRFNKHASNIGGIFATLKYEAPPTVFRGVKNLTKYSVGDTITFKHFVSTSVDPNQAYTFTNEGSGSFYIIKPKTPALTVSYDKSEMEVLLNRNLEFVVEEVLLNKNFYCAYPESDYGINRKMTAFVLKEK
jgi:hypothetical protein